MQGLTIYKSSAGSGKTFTLVQEYLKLVMVNPFQYRQVLAVTFTNKATREMKDRIVGSLSALASLSSQEAASDTQYQQLATFLKQQNRTDVQIQERAEKVLTLILNDYSHFSVSTIESFFQRIVRAFARELDIPLTYDIELRSQLVLDQLVGDLLLEMGENKSLTRLFQRFIQRNLQEEKTWHVDGEIKSIGRQIFQEQFQRLANKYPEEEDRIDKTLNLAKELRSLQATFEAVMRSKAEAAIQIMKTYQLGAEDFSYKQSGVGGYFSKVIYQKDFAPSNRVKKAYEAHENWYAKKSPRKEEIEAALSGGLFSALGELIDFYSQSKGEYILAGEILRHIYSFGVLNDLQDRLTEYRREHGQMLISDTGFLLNRVVGTTYDAPFIYEKVGNQYLHYLLDEFQDTSDMQWDNLWPLVGDAMASGNGSLIVGDVKQSIYRWRNGNMKLLMHEVEDQARRQGQAAEVKQLDSNWRTAKEVVEFNNLFFETALDRLKEDFGVRGESLQLAYHRLAQHPQKSNIPGRVEISFFVDDKEAEQTWEDQAELHLLELIQTLTDKGPEGKGYDGRDITLLVRKNREGVRLANFLQKNHIKVASAESLLVDTHIHVRFLHAVLRHLNHEEDPIGLATLCFYYSQLEEQQQEKAVGSVHTLFSKRNLEEQIPELEAAKERLRQLAVYECLEQLIRMFPDLTVPNAYVQGFLDAALEYSSTYDASISGFLTWWEEQRAKKAIAAAPIKEAVQIMTVHKSKGLEFPVVILPYANWTLEPERRDILWVETEGMEAPYNTFPFLAVSPSSKLDETALSAIFAEEQVQSALDNLNLLYVAMTRPQHRLYLLTKGEKAGKKKSGGKMKAVSQLIGQALVNMKSGFECLGGESYLHGTDERIRIEEESDAALSKELQSNPSPLSNWNQSIRIKYSSNRYLKTDMLTRTDKISAGKLLHEALAFVETTQDIPEAVERMLRLGYLPRSETSFLHKQLEQAIHHLPVMDWYSGNWEVRNEAEILHQTGEVLRPDRVMIQGKKAIVVDYKTGTPNARYHKQIKEYGYALQALGYAPVQGFIYYLTFSQVEQVL